MVDELIKDYEYFCRRGEGIDTCEWMEDAVRCIKELQAEIQRLSEYEWMYNELNR